MTKVLEGGDAQFSHKVYSLDLEKQSQDKYSKPMFHDNQKHGYPIHR
jgi:hypothetical protein